jgi:hypothetical protein
MMQTAPPCYAHARLSGRQLRCRNVGCGAAVCAASAAASQPQARVWIVGAGPGGVDLLTIGASKALAACDGAKRCVETRSTLARCADAARVHSPRCSGCVRRLGGGGGASAGACRG